MFDKQDSAELWQGHYPIDHKGGIKHDDGKQRFDLIPPEALTALASVLAFGAKKYSARNWENGFDYGRVFAATMRHLWAWWSRKDRDEETGFSHLWHALACVAFLIAFESRGVGKDDRSGAPEAVR